MHSQTYLNKVARPVNERSRKTLTFETRQRNLTPVLHRLVEPIDDETLDKFGERNLEPIIWKPLCPLSTEPSSSHFGHGKWVSGLPDAGAGLGVSWSEFREYCGRDSTLGRARIVIIPMEHISWKEPAIPLLLIKSENCKERLLRAL